VRGNWTEYDHLERERNEETPLSEKKGDCEIGDKLLDRLPRLMSDFLLLLPLPCVSAPSHPRVPIIGINKTKKMLPNRSIPPPSFGLRECTSVYAVCGLGVVVSVCVEFEKVSVVDVR